ncbi:MAG: fibronectin type III domain-containing protein [Pseudomonadota bacterium]
MANLYKALAYDLAAPTNYSGFSTEISVTTPDCVPPSAPGNPTFSAILGSSATVTWTAATDNVGVAGYRYSINGGSSWTDVGNVLTTNLTGLALSTTYTVLVQARDAAGNWSGSGSGSFTTLSTVSDTMTYVGGSSGSPPLSQITGFGTGMGSLAPVTTSTGKTIIAYWSDLELAVDQYYQFSVVSMVTYFRVDGFTSNPGAAWLQSISGPGATTFTGATATFNYTNGSAVWTWPSAPNFVGTVNMILVHQ